MKTCRWNKEIQRKLNRIEVKIIRSVAGRNLIRPQNEVELELDKKVKEIRAVQPELIYIILEERKQPSGTKPTFVNQYVDKLKPGIPLKRIQFRC